MKKCLGHKDIDLLEKKRVGEPSQGHVLVPYPSSHLQKKQIGEDCPAPEILEMKLQWEKKTENISTSSFNDLGLNKDKTSKVGFGQWINVPALYQLSSSPMLASFSTLVLPQKSLEASCISENKSVEEEEKSWPSPTRSDVSIF